MAATDPNRTLKYLNKNAIVKTAALAGLGLAIVVLVIESALTMALPTTRDLIYFALLGVAAALVLVLLIPLFIWLEQKYPEYFRRDKA